MALLRRIQETWFFSFLLLVMRAVAQTEIPPPTFGGGQHFRITAVDESSFLEVKEAEDGSRSFSGYLIRMLDAISRPDRANFTYELFTPSGYGSSCRPQIIPSLNESEHHPFSSHYFKQYKCATDDVAEVFSDDANFPPTDLYWGMFYITGSRLLRNHFSIPFSPPYKGTPAMMGTAVRIPNIDDLVKQQDAGDQPPACVPGSWATTDFIVSAKRDLKIKEFFGTEEDMAEAIHSGECRIFVFDAPLAAQFVSRLKEKNECHDQDGQVSASTGTHSCRLSL